MYDIKTGITQITRSEVRFYDGSGDQVSVLTNKNADKCPAAHDDEGRRMWLPWLVVLVVMLVTLVVVLVLLWYCGCIAWTRTEAQSGELSIASFASAKATE